MAKLIGTAGHVDHGKTTLIQALTGIDADRLPEEKRRGMTIDVGFAYLDLPDHGRVSIVDVPGHEKFVTNMLVGALGIDVALLCVSADESVMPQTREHFEIIELLPVDRLVVAMTRADLADGETREFTAAEITELLTGSRFEASPIIEVSSTTGAGLNELRAALSEALAGAQTDRDPSLGWYLPIDRVFSAKGHGCVVTGTLARSRLAMGDRAMIEPGHREVRIRGVEVHGQAVESAEPGNRVGLNLAGVRTEDLQRGSVIGAIGALFETKIFDARMKWKSRPKHGLRIRVSAGAEEVIGKVFLSDVDPEIAQIRLESPLAIAQAQPIIVRRYSPPDLLGGGRVLVPQARIRRKAERAEAVEHTDLAAGILEAIGDDPNGRPTEEICRRMGRSPQELGSVIEELSRGGAIAGFAGLWLSAAGLESAKAAFLAGLDKVHEKHSNRATVSRELAVAEAGLKWSGKPLDRLMTRFAADGALQLFGASVRLPKFQVQLPARQRELLDRVVECLQKCEIDVPSPRDIADQISVPPQAILEILKLGQQAGEIVLIAESLAYTPKQLEGIRDRIRTSSHGEPFTPSEMRESLGTSRKYIIPLLEYFDSTRVTMRVGEKRVLKG